MNSEPILRYTERRRMREDGSIELLKSLCETMSKA